MGTSFRESKENLTRSALSATGRAEQLGNEAESEFFKRSLAFDARGAAEESARGIGNRLINDPTQGLGRQLELLRGESAGRFRTDTGFALEDRDRIFNDFNQRLSDAIAANSLQAEGLNLRNTGQIGQFGQNVQNRFVNLLGGGLDRAQQEENASGGGLFGKLLGGAAGLVLPGVGNAVGEFIGDKVTGR